MGITKRAKSAVCKGLLFVAIFVCIAIPAVNAQTGSARTELGSKTAKDGFKNETETGGKFNNWRTDGDARVWLAAMNYKLAEIESVAATKPHGEKADVEVRIRTKAGERVEGISIKLVSSPNGFNQIDKRWLATYTKMWKMPPDVETALKLFLGETPPVKPSRDVKRMYLNELYAASQKTVTDFFTAKKHEIVFRSVSGRWPTRGWLANGRSESNG